MRRRALVSASLLILFLVNCSGSGSGGQNNGGNNSGGNNNGGGGGGDNGGGNIANCQIFPSDNPWNLDIRGFDVHENSDDYLDSMSAGSEFLHPDFGSDPTYGIPYVTVTGDQLKVPMSFDEADESDPGPYPIPADAPVEVGDQHVLVLDTDNCILYEIYDATYVGPGWEAFSGAVFDLSSNALRPDGWTSADAAGLPILPGLVRYDEAVEQGAINHALRFTANVTQEAYIYPATHEAGSTTDPGAPPMGLRLRLKEEYNISGFTGTTRVVLEALKKYGMILADNGSDWFISGSTDSRWDDEDLEQLKTVPANAFEVIETGPLHY
jgi:hypothetical protein